MAEPAEKVVTLPDPSTASWRQISDEFSKPVDLQSAGDQRLFVVEQRGVIWVIDAGQKQEQPFLDLRDRVNAGTSGTSERGLLGLAFHPDFINNGMLYVNYTNTRGDTVIARFAASADRARADPDSEQVIMTIAQPFPNHNGGGLAFGPDGYLYIATGDGGSAADPHGNGQRLDTLLGKILRINVSDAESYAIPPDNPFSMGGGLPEIWIYGLRNPWRFSFDPATGDLYIGDVGQNKWEEIDFVAAGSAGGTNLGWNLREGMHPFATQEMEGLTDPVAEYSHEGGNCSVTGGVVARGAELPAWEGVYLYADYCSGNVWGLLQDPDGNWITELLFQTGLRISSFGLDNTGRIYLVHHGGSIHRLEPAP